MAITNKDVEKLKEVFATKADLEKLKDVFATKEDLNRFATKEDLNRFATKEDLKNSISGLRTELTEKIDETAKDVKKEIMDGLDKVMDELLDAREDRTLAVGKDREQDRRLGDLENRVQKVEARY